MPTISFKIRPGTSRKCSVYLIFSYGRRKELRYSTGWRIEDKQNWNFEKQRIKNVVAEPNAQKINQHINNLASFFPKKYDELILSNIDVNNRVLRNEIDIFLKKKRIKNSPSSYKTLLECYEWYHKHFSINPLPTTKKPLSQGTIKSYKTALKLIQGFNDNEYALNYDRITMEFYSSFLEFLREKNYSNNYISKQIKILKTIMNYAWEHKYHNNLDFKHKGFTKISEEIDNIYLTTDELDKISSLDLEGYLNNARDLFILAANTGLRVSDFNRLSIDNIKEHKGATYIEIRTQKTDAIVAIPINSSVKKILNKNNGHPPSYMAEQKINYALKTIGSRAGLIEIVSFHKTIGGQKTLIKKRKSELITNHTARRSFCTNAYKSGMPTIDIMAISGHKTERSFYNYIKITDLERLDKISKHSFFN